MIYSSTWYSPNEVREDTGRYMKEVRTHTVPLVSYNTGTKLRFHAFLRTVVSSST